MADIEKRTEAFIQSAFAHLRSAEGAFDLLAKFERIEMRDSIRALLGANIANIIAKARGELADAAALFESQKSHPPVYKNTPPVAGAIAWANALYLRWVALAAGASRTMLFASLFRFRLDVDPSSSSALALLHLLPPLCRPIISAACSQKRPIMKLRSNPTLFASTEGQVLKSGSCVRCRVYTVDTPCAWMMMLPS